MSMSVMKPFVMAATAAAGVALPVGTYLALAAISGGMVIAAETESLPAAQVIVIRAQNACFSAAIPVTGFLVARKEAVVTLDNPGSKVVEVLVSEGDRVTAGQTLVRLTNSGQGSDAGKSTTALKAPVAGIITRSTAVVGATASPVRNEPLFRIAVDSEIELEAEIPSINMPALSSGQRARIQIDNGRELLGQVRLVPAAVDQKTQLGRARISLERDAALRPGMFARASIEANRSCGISVPRSAVTYRTEGTSVQVVRENVVETRRVQVGIHSDVDTEIREGLREGDMVVANAGSSLRDGDRVRPILADAARTELR
jgi:multidrug efflux pump subunit AcrA (membrane-fusion protein)